MAETGGEASERTLISHWGHLVKACQKNMQLTKFKISVSVIAELLDDYVSPGLCSPLVKT